MDLSSRPVFSQGSGGEIMPIGLGSGCGVKSSTRLPYDRGAYSAGAGAGAGLAASLAVFCEPFVIANRSLGDSGFELGLLANKRGYVVLKLRHWQRRHVANGWRDGLSRNVLTAFSSMVSRRCG